MKVMIAILAVFALVGCKSINFGALTGGASAVASAPTVRADIVKWINYDEQAMAALQGPGDFFQIGYDFITRKGPETPLLDLIAASPDYVEQIPAQWSAMKAAFDEYEERTGITRPATVTQFIANGEVAYASAKKAIAVSDKFQKGCQLWAMAAPLAGLVSPIPLPGKIPGCMV